MKKSSSSFRSPPACHSFALLILTAAFPLLFASSAFSATVTYTMQTDNFNSLQTTNATSPPFAGTFNNGDSELANFANNGSFGNTPGAAAFQTFTTTGNGNTGTARALQIGDTFTITAFTSGNPSAGGYLGISFRDSTTYSSFENATDAATEARFQLDNTGGWKVYNAGTPVDSNQGANTDRTFTIKITSSTTFDATVGGTTYHNLTMAAGGGAIDSFAIYTFGDSNQNSFWKNASLTDSGNVELGYALDSGTFTPGLISDGLEANSTTVVRANNVFVGGDAGSQVNLDQANTYTGATTINENATAEAQHANALGSTASGTTVSSGGALKLFGGATGISYASEALTINGVGVSNVDGALRNVGGDNTWNGGITLGSNSRINADTTGTSGSLTIAGNITGGNNTLFLGAQGGSGGNTGGDIVVSGAVSGSGATQDGVVTSIFKDGVGVLTLSGNNTYSGATLLNQGTILVGDNAAFGTGTVQIHWASSDAKVLASSDSTARTLDNNLNIYNNFTLGQASGGTGALTIGGSGKTVDLGDDDAPTTRNISVVGSHTIAGAIGGGVNNSLQKSGIGRLDLTGNNNYLGSTTVSAGILAINGDSSLATGDVTILSGATLEGSGTVGGATTFQSGATHSPGNSPGLQTFSSDLSYLSGATFTWELTANTVSGRGTFFDGVDVTAGGTLTINSGVTNNLVFNGAESSVSWADSFWNTDRSWLVFSNANNPTLTSQAVFDTLVLSGDSDGTQLISERPNASFSWRTSNNDIFLDYAAVPEPSTYALLSLSALAFGAYQWRRRRRGGN